MHHWQMGGPIYEIESGVVRRFESCLRENDSEGAADIMERLFHGVRESPGMDINRARDTFA